MPSFSDLRTQLNQSGIQKTNSALYTVIDQLLDQIEAFSKSTNKDLTQKNTDLTKLFSRSFLTANPESLILPFSRELLAGTGITFDDSIANQRTVNSSSSTDHVVMSDGHNPPSPLDDGNGNFIYVGYIP